ncbi:lactoylglutathione lyase [bacterium]|nr:lactoylglutathione lyase [bacterium]
MKEVEFILYVANQKNSAYFYEQLFGIEPCLNVPGMTEFQLTDFVKLGLMPENGIAGILSPRLPHPNKASGIPRCELYFKVENPEKFFERGIQSGGKMISDMADRDWGDKVGYISDLDGHVIAFAEEMNK